MKTTDKQKVADTLLEKPKKIKVGMFTFKAYPLTLAQIYEMGVFANQIKSADFKDGDKVNVMQELIKHSNDARLMQEVFIVCLFRKKWKRRLFRMYLKKRLTILHFSEIVKFLSSSFNINFFLTSITFLTQAKVMTEPKTTPLGQQSGQ